MDNSNSKPPAGNQPKLQYSNHQLLASKVGREGLTDVIKYLKAEHALVLKEVEGAAMSPEETLRAKVAALHKLSNLIAQLECTQKQT